MSEPRRDVIVFAGALYDAPLWTNRQQIATRLAERGWRVLYVEPRFLLWHMLLGDFPGAGGKLRWLLRQIAPRRVRPNLWVLAQANLVPGSRRAPSIGRWNHRLWNAWHIHWHARALGFRDPALLIYDTEAAEFLDDFPRSRVVYDCVDDHRAEPGANPTLVEREEAAILARAAAVAVTTPPLCERFRALHRTVRLVPNAADVEAFLHPPAAEPADVAAIPHPRVGTVGALDAYKMDVELLRTVIEKHPEWQFVFLGPVEYVGIKNEASSITRERDVATLAEFPNVRLLGVKPREETPAYVHALDVAIIPYRESPYNRASFPLKFWEFAAAGKPIVASGLPSLAPFGHLVALVSSPEAFAEAIRSALSEGGERARARVEEAKQHSWDSRVDAIEDLLRTIGVRPDFSGFKNQV